MNTPPPGSRVHYNARTGHPYAYRAQHGRVEHAPIDVQFEGIGFTLACHPDELTVVGEGA